MYLFHTHTHTQSPMMIDTPPTQMNVVRAREEQAGRQKKKQESSLCTESGSGGGGRVVVVVVFSVASVFTTYKLTLPNRKAERSSRRFDRVRERETVSSTWMEEKVCETKYCQSIKGTARNTARASVRTDRASEERVGRQDAVMCCCCCLFGTHRTDCVGAAARTGR